MEEVTDIYVGKIEQPPKPWPLIVEEEVTKLQKKVYDLEREIIELKEKSDFDEITKEALMHVALEWRRDQHVGEGLKEFSKNGGPNKMQWQYGFEQSRLRKEFDEKNKDL